MTKKELIDAIAKQTQLTLKQAEDAFKATFQVIQQAMIQDGKVVVPEFGSFTTKSRAERKGRNPSTGKEIIIPKATVAAFKPSAQLKDAVNTDKQ
ncbi:MAG: HU family DNA-binding protein [Gammaproteobacteria bacterium]